MDYGRVLGASTVGAGMGAGAVTMLPETGSSAEMMIIALAAAVAVGGAFAIRVFWRRGKNIGD